MPDPPVRYRIDSHGTIVWVDEAFDAFAQENGAPGLGDRVVGTDLFAQISGAPVVAVYRALLTRLVGERRPVSFDYRCDAPDLERRMRLRVAPLDDGGFEFVSTTLEVVPRSDLPLDLIVGTGRPTPPGGELLRLCAWCKRVAVEDVGWMEVDEAAVERGLLDRLELPPVTHAVCPRCEVRLLSA